VTLEKFLFDRYRYHVLTHESSLGRQPSREPHKHAHVLLFNMTYDEKAPDSDRTRGGWRALQTRKLFVVQKEATRVFGQHLLKGLQSLAIG